MKNRLALKLLLMGIALTLGVPSVQSFSQQQGGATGNTPAANSGGGSSSSNVPTDPNVYEERFDYGQLNKVPQTDSKKSYEDTLYRVSLNTMEDGGDWVTTMPFDYGKSILALRNGAPQGVKNSPDTVNQPSGATANDGGSATAGYFTSKADMKSKVLGVKVNFYPGRRAAPWLRVDAIQPIPLDGIVKGFEVWVSGRELKHDLYIVVNDAKGVEQNVYMGRLNFLGWRRLVAQVPTYIEQQDPGNLSHRGLTFKGFLVKFRMLDAMGSYFIYFDNLSAQVSRYSEENLTKDDIRDNW